MRLEIMLTSWWITLAVCGGTLSPCRGDEPVRAGTTIQLPTFGVAVDAVGELSIKTFVDPTGRVRAERIAAARARLAPDIAAASHLRKVSLVALERSVAECVDKGEPVGKAQLFLAGLQRVQFVFVYPESGDIVLAGPAEGWVADGSGRAVGLTTGRPVLRLDDLAVALRVYLPREPGRPLLGCTIDPPPDGLARLRQFQRTIPHTVRISQRSDVANAAVHGTRSALGTADIRIFGVAPATHFAQVLVEADYRMKCLAIGLEPPPVPMTTFLGALRSVSPTVLQRWWFTPDYKCLRQSDDGLALEVVGQGVELRTEDRAIAADGSLSSSTSEPHPAARAFAESFTERFPSIAAASPIYAELRNVIDLAIVAAWLRRQGALERTGWKAELLRDEARFAVQTLPVPRKVACVANVLWKGNRMLLPAGGGVSIQPDEALRNDQLTTAPPELAARRAAIQSARPSPPAWWWD
jgi:hypothetical protein